MKKDIKEEPVVATLKITHCEQCPFLDVQRHYTADSFDMEYDWFCKKKNNKEIAGSVGWSASESRMVKIPKWCPLTK